MGGPTTASRLREIFTDRDDGYEDVLDHWDEVAAGVIALLDLIEEKRL